MMVCHNCGTHQEQARVCHWCGVKQEAAPNEQPSVSVVRYPLGRDGVAMLLAEQSLDEILAHLACEPQEELELLRA